MKNILLLVLVFLLSSCSLLTPVKSDDATNYVFNRLPCVRTYAKHNITLYVAPIASDPVYDTDNMAYSRHPYVIEYFAKNKWADTPAQLLKPLVLKTLRDTNHFHAVTSSPHSIRYDYVLNLRVIELNQVFYTHSSCERFILHAEIVNSRTGKIVASREFVVVKPALYRSPYGGVAAANRAVEDALEQLAYFTVRVI